MSSADALTKIDDMPTLMKIHDHFMEKSMVAETSGARALYRLVAEEVMTLILRVQVNGDWE